MLLAIDRAHYRPCVRLFPRRKTAHLDLVVAPTRNRLLLGALGLKSLGVCRACCRHLCILVLLGLFLLAITFLFFAHFQFPQP